MEFADGGADEGGAGDEGGDEEEKDWVWGVWGHGGCGWGLGVVRGEGEGGRVYNARVEEFGEARDVAAEFLGCDGVVVGEVGDYGGVWEGMGGSEVVGGQEVVGGDAVGDGVDDVGGVGGDLGLGEGDGV